MKIWLQQFRLERIMDIYSIDYISNNARLCDSHFEETSFTNTLKNRLLKFAVPIGSLQVQRQCDSVTVPCTSSMNVTSNNVSELSFNQQEFATSTPIAGMSLERTPKTKKTARLLSTPTAGEILERTPKTKEITRLRSAVSKLKKKLFVQKNGLLHELQQKLTASQYEFVLSQLNSSGRDPRGRRWSAENKAFALQLYHQSSGTYRRLRKHLAFPCVKTLTKCVRHVSKDVGFCPSLYKALEKKLKSMPASDKICILSLDEMSIKSAVTYNRYLDIIDGFESARRSYGQRQPATQALVFMLRGITKNWKQVIAYYFRAKATPKGWLDETALHILDKALSCGFVVKAIVCDQGPVNRVFYDNQGVTELKPYFEREIEKKKNLNEKEMVKIFALYDVPHLLKSVRNNLMKYDCKFTHSSSEVNERCTASWKHIEEFYKYDCNGSSLRLARKLTDVHIYGKGLRSMKVKLAAQVFSNTVAAGLDYMVSRDENASAYHTAIFVHKMNDLFDSLNSRTLHTSNSIISAVSEKSKHISEWIEYKKWIRSWRFKNEIKNKVVIPYCQGGFVLTINAVIGLWEELKKNKVPYLATNRLNQDCLENTFASIRKRGGFRDNPCAEEFRSAVRSVVVCNFMKCTSSKNCEDDNDFNLLNLSNANVKSAILQDSESDFDELVIDEDIEEPPTFSEVDDNVIAYISGVMSHSLFKKSTCDECKRLLIGEKLLDNSRLFIYFKEYKDAPHGLKWPTTPYYEYVRSLCGVFFKYIGRYLSEKDIRKNMCAVLGNVPFDFFGEHEHKYEVKNKIVDSFALMMIKHEVRIMNSKNVPNISKKLKHVQNQ